MKTLLLEYSNKTITLPISIKREFLWYNVQEKRMDKFVGGKLVFDGFTPRTIDHSENFQHRVPNAPDIRKWISEIGSRFGVEINEEETGGLGIAIDIDDSVEAQVEYSLNRYGIRYSEI